MPLGKVEGNITIGDEHYAISGFGYNDHDWGYLKSIQWAPWLIIKGENLIISVVKTPMDSLVHFQDLETEYIGTIKSIDLHEMNMGTHEACNSKILFPSKIVIECENSLRIETEISDKYRIVNMGFEKRECLAFHDNNARSTIFIKGWEKYNKLITTIYNWNLLIF
jgi:hypothetical protein